MLSPELIEYCCEIIGKTPQEMENGAHAGTWYIRPALDKRSAKEEEHLFSEVRRAVLGKFSGRLNASRARLVAERIRAFSLLDSVPLLVGMVIIAQRWADHTSYWPHVQEHIFGDDGDVTFFRQEISPAITTLWLRAYRHSGGTLYSPREGRTHIKWPLAHAGLNSSELELLDQYLGGLVQDLQPGVRHHPLLAVEVDELHAHLTQWAEDTGHNRHILARRLLGSEGLTIAEIAQIFLRQRWEHRKDEQEWGLPARRHRSVHFPVKIQFDGDLGAVKCVLQPREWSGQIDHVSVEYEGNNSRLIPMYLPERDASLTTRHSFSIKHPTWATSFTFKIDGQLRTGKIPSSPFRFGLGLMLFSAMTGARVRHLNQNEDYWLLAPNGSQGEPWLLAMFDFQEEQASFPDIWKGYSVWQVRSRELADLVGATYGEFVEKLQGNLADFQLPTEAELSLPRLRLVGGRNMGGTSDVLSFHVSYPPRLLVEGELNSAVHLKLLKRDEAVGNEHEVGSTDVVPIEPNAQPLIDLFEEDADSGLYSITGGYNSITFRLVDLEQVRAYPAYRLDLRVYGVHEVPQGAVYPRKNVDSLSLTVDSWPFALVQLVCSSAEGTILGPILDSGSKGTVTFTLREHFPTLPDGPIRVWCRHRFIRSPEICFTDQPYLAEINPMYVQNRLNELNLVVKGAKPGAALQGAIFGPEPWSESVVQLEGTVSNLGRARVLIPNALSSNSQFLVLGVKHTSPNSTNPFGTVIYAGNIPGKPRYEGPWRLGSAGNWGEWSFWLDWLVAQPIFDPDLRKLVSLSWVRRELLRELGEHSGPRRAWIKPGHRLRMDLLLLIQGSSAPRLACITGDALGVKPWSGLEGTSRSQPAPGLTLTSAQAFQMLNQVSPHEIVVQESEYKAAVTIEPTDQDGQWKLTAIDPLLICFSCNRIVPVWSINIHQRPFPEETAQCNHFEQISAGDSRYVQLIVEVDLIVWGESLMGLVRRILRGQKFLPVRVRSQTLELVLEFRRMIPPGQGERWCEEVIEAASAAVSMHVYPLLPVDGGRLIHYAAIYRERRVAVNHILKLFACWLGEGDGDASVESK